MKLMRLLIYLNLWADALMLANAQNYSAYNNVTLAHIILEKLEKVQKEMYK